MRQNLKDIVALLTELLPFPEPIVELGALQVESQVGFADLRPLFPGKRYLGCDMRSGPGVDRLENMHRLSFADGSVGSILCLDTLEHVANCHLAVREMHRVLASGGLLVLASVMDFEIHEFPADYWRFTPKGIEMLLRDFEALRVYYQGDPQKPHTVLGLGRRSGAVWPAVLDNRLAALAPEPAVAVPLGLGDDAFGEETHLQRLAGELAEAREALRRTTADLDAMRASRTWRIAATLRDHRILGPPLRLAARLLTRRGGP